MRGTTGSCWRKGIGRECGLRRCCDGSRCCRFRPANNQRHSTRIELGRTNEEEAVSEKSARSNLRSVEIPKMERHYSFLCSEVQSWLTEIGHEDYTSRKAGLKNEI